MKKLLSILVILSLLVTPMLGMAEDKVTIKFANYAILEAGYTEFWENVEKNFEAANPNIDIEYVTAPYGDILTTVINMAGGGERVDLVFGEIGWVPTAEDAGLSVPVTDILSEDYLADFYPAVLENFKVNGELYGLPTYISPYVLYYNKDIFTAAGLDPNTPPTTYDEMLEMAAKIDGLTTADGNKIYAFGQTTASVPVSGSSLTAFIYNFGGDVLTADGALSIDNEGFKQAIEMVKLLDDKGYNPQNAKLKDLRNLFALGQLAMYYDQSWGFNGVNSINPEAVNFTASAAPLKGGAGTGESILQSHCLLFTSLDTAKYEAIQKLTAFLISEETLGDYLTKITPAYPATLSMSGMEAIANSNVLKGASGAISNVKVVPAIARLGDLNLELCTLAQAVTISDTPVDEAIEAFRTTMEAILAE